MVSTADMKTTAQVSNQVKPVKRNRSTGFPVEMLSKATEVVRSSVSYGLRHSLEAFAGFMGSKTTNSGTFKQKLAAYRDWGLVSRSGEQISLTELGKRIAMPVSDDDEKAAIQEAFLSCDVFANVLESSVKGQPLRLSMLANAAVQNQGISPASRDSFVNCFAVSAVFAGLATRPDEQTIELAMSKDPLITRMPEVKREVLDRDFGSSGSTPISTSAATVRQVWPVAGGEMVLEIRSGRALPLAAYQSLADVVERLEQLAELLSWEDVSNATD